MALPNDGIQPTPFELRLRFISGAVLGALTCAQFASAGSITELALFGGAGALAAGLLARHFGDRFWFALRQSWPF